MGPKADLAGLTQDSGTLNLAHSLMRSRLTWITNAFDQLDETNMEFSRQFLGLAEMQIGPHIFPKVKFYRIVGSIPTDTVRALSNPLRRLLAFEFADNPKSFFWVPPDLGIDYKRHTNLNSLRVYFFASPRCRAMDRRPSHIREEWPHYFSADKALTRVNIDIFESDQEIVDAMTDYVKEHSVKVWRDYRQTLCQSAPTVKYWYAFFSKQHRRQLLESAKVVVSDVKTPSVDVSRAAAKALASEEKVHTDNEDQNLLLPAVDTYSRGGKVGYNAAVAAAYFKSRQNADFETEDEDRIDSDEDMDSAKHNGLAANADKLESQITKMIVNQGIKRSAIDSPTSRKTRKTASSPITNERICSHCKCGETPIWRRGPKGTGTLCNACGVKWKLGKILQ
ncbi:hypothetical protein COEREDRAFT_5532 [Coemansia reversa NRRL 1564]|uniref:GATA-type domain-containing protein n=1 Tax=Coemansia reversa (strain ATCC 12441 / NRRL 1564) TaxID=763665 RepID=A0A2G5BL55_COERN|nr:hypothetical protein COEREDRAFT_5532 [Coemansia reversa NRRL 1564]|eukprot:PIA19721.1 hypothetical protein COEREDRAFT_5532 [Coemansia reversa NRRL 1564]